MFNRILLTGSVLACLACWSLAASAEPKTRKPTVCVNFKTFEQGKEVIGVCLDGKRKRILSTWQTVKINVDGVPTAYVVGF